MNRHGSHGINQPDRTGRGQCRLARISMHGVYYLPWAGTSKLKQMWIEEAFRGRG
jgi:hypothetical protein